MIWWRDGMVRIQHKPTGLTVECDQSRSIYRNKLAALAALKGKLWSITRGGHFAVRERPVRSYTDADMDRLDIADMPRWRRWGAWHGS
jgi:protein subunit release factor A